MDALNKLWFKLSDLEFNTRLALRLAAQDSDEECDLQVMLCHCKAAKATVALKLRKPRVAPGKKAASRKSK